MRGQVSAFGEHLVKGMMLTRPPRRPSVAGTYRLAVSLSPLAIRQSGTWLRLSVNWAHPFLRLQDPRPVEVAERLPEAAGGRVQVGGRQALQGLAHSRARLGSRQASCWGRRGPRE